jgi:hypothetical protein
MLMDVLTKKNIEQTNVETAHIVNVSQRNINKLETRGNLEQEQKWNTAHALKYLWNQM